jgi:hypothetical protein
LKGAQQRVDVCNRTNLEILKKRVRSCASNFAVHSDPFRTACDKNEKMITWQTTVARKQPRSSRLTPPLQIGVGRVEKYFV